MSKALDKLLAILQSQLPDTKSEWLFDLRTEAVHIPAGLLRMRFQWSGLLAAIGHLLRLRVGVQKMGQILLASALSIFCLVGLIYTATAPDEDVKIIFALIFLIYAMAAVFAFVNLNLLKRFALVCSFLWAVTWVVLSLGVFDSSPVPVVFLRAISIEAAFIMASLFIAASYLGWIEDGRHA